MFMHTGMCPKNGSVFSRASLNMGPIFYEQIPHYGEKSLKNCCALGAKSQKMGTSFQKKILNMGTYF